MFGKTIVRKFQILNRSKFLTKSTINKSLKLPHLPVRPHPIHSIMLSQTVVVILSVSQFISYRSQIPVCGRFYVIVKSFVWNEVRQRKVLYVSQTLNYLPLAFRWIMKFKLACVVKQSCVRIKLYLFVELKKRLVPKTQVPKRVNHSYFLNITILLPSFLSFFSQSSRKFLIQQTLSCLQLRNINYGLEQSFKVFTIFIKIVLKIISQRITDKSCVFDPQFSQCKNHLMHYIMSQLHLPEVHLQNERRYQLFELVLSPLLNFLWVFQRFCA